MQRKLIVGLAAALSLVASSATAGHSFLTSFALDDNSPSAYSDATSKSEYGTDHPDSGVTHIEGITIAHEDGTTLSPPPNNGDVVAQLKATARWKPFCIQSTMTIDGKWKSPMDTPPSGLGGTAVAQIQFVDPLGQTINAWVTLHTSTHGNVSGEHYAIETLDMGDSACSSGNVTVDATTFGTVPNSSPTRYVSQNPAACGTYDVEGEYTDKNGGNHSDAATYDIVGC